MPKKTKPAARKAAPKPATKAAPKRIKGVKPMLDTSGKPAKARKARAQASTTPPPVEAQAKPQAPALPPLPPGTQAGPDPEGPVVVIDLRRMCIVKLAPGLRLAEYWAALLCPPEAFALIGMAKRDLCRFSALELAQLFTQAGGNFYRWDNYQQGLNATHEWIGKLEVDTTGEGELYQRLGKLLPPTQPRSQFIHSSAAHEFHMQAKGVDIAATPPHGAAEVPTLRPQPPPPAPGALPPPPSEPQAGRKRRGAAQAPATPGDAQAAPQKAPRQPREPKRQGAPGEFVPSPKGQKLWDALDAARTVAKGATPTKDQAGQIGVGVGLSLSSAHVSYGRWLKQRGLK